MNGFSITIVCNVIRHVKENIPCMHISTKQNPYTHTHISGPLFCVFSNNDMFDDDKYIDKIMY